jgi:prefoldin subunit 5
MCWKDEWAKAINNINNAIEHIDYAQKKLETRLARNIKNLERIKNNPKFNYPPMLAPVEALIKKNTNGIENCKETISELKSRQALLFCMIHTLGII